MSKAFAEEYRELSVKFLKTSLREQFLILLCGVVVIVLCTYSLMLEPQLNSIEEMNKNKVNANKTLAKQDKQIDTLTKKLRFDPNTAVAERIDALRGQIQTLTNQLQSQTNKLVPANQMADMLERVLTKSRGLTLIALDSIAPESLLPVEQKASEGLYRHGMSLIFEGSYFDIQLYLERLESLEWQFYWKKFDYIVGEYPLARVELEIYTLSTSEAFMGISTAGVSD